MLNQNPTQQINSYLRSQQLLNRQLHLLKRIKKAEPTRQDVSAFNNQMTSFNVQICDVQKLEVTSKGVQFMDAHTKKSHLNQLTYGVNQYATV